jgi:membrane protein YdbS with pleckstrin-like domain
MAEAATELALDGTEHHLHPRTRLVWGIGSALVLLGIGIGLAVLAFLNDESELGALSLGVAVVLMVAVFGWAHLEWTRWTWSAWDDALELKHGVVSRHESLVPYHRIQQIDVERDPLERLVGLSSLILRTAAATTDAKLPGIAVDHADFLRHELLRRAGIDDAV